MQTPEIGKIYRSTLDPSIRILVEEFDPGEIDPDDQVHTGFYVTGCHPDDADSMDGLGYDFIQSEWEEHGFTLET